LSLYIRAYWPGSPILERCLVSGSRRRDETS
jgi:hypothetical protein